MSCSDCSSERRKNDCDNYNDENVDGVCRVMVIVFKVQIINVMKCACVKRYFVFKVQL